MAVLRFIHASDLHLDTPFRELTRWNRELAESLKDATFKSFARIIDLCIAREVDFLLIAGDIFNSEQQSLAAQLRFVAELHRLSKEGIPCYFICGNHDPLDSWMDQLQLPDRVHRFGSGDAESRFFEKEGVRLAEICGISYPQKKVTKNLAKRYERTGDAPFSIALLHGSIGATGPHENYAPFTKEDVLAKGFDYWALGHIHKRQELSGAGPAIMYCGNPQGRDFGETGKKGCLLVTLEEGRKPVTEFLPTQLIRFEIVEVDLGGAERINQIPERLNTAITAIEGYEDGAAYILRVRISGRTPLHDRLKQPEEVEELMLRYNEEQSSAGRFTLIDRIEVATRSELDLERIARGKDFPAEILRTFADYDKDATEFAGLLQEIDGTFPARARRHIDPLDEDAIREILENAKWLLMDHLIKEEDDH
jgi:exonuclease SbcD